MTCRLQNRRLSGSAKSRDKDTPLVKLFVRYMGYIVSTVENEHSFALHIGNSFQRNHELTLQKNNPDRKLPLLALNLNSLQEKRVFCIR